METFWSDIGDFFIRFGLRILAGALLLLIGFRIAKWATKYIQQKHHKRRGEDPLTPTMRSFLGSAVGIGMRLLIIVGFVILMGANTSSVVAMLSSAALAIGLALQNTFSNIAGGLLIILFKPFAIGDFIVVSDQSGVVQDINIYCTRILTPDNRSVVLPNGIVSNSVLVNASTEEIRRAEILLQVAYAEDARHVCALLIQAAAEDARVLAEPAPQAMLTNLLGGVQTYTVWAWCSRSDLLNVTNELRLHAKERLEQNGIALSRARFDVDLRQ